MAYPSRGTWRFRNVTQAFDFAPLLTSISIEELHPDGLSTFSCTVEADEDFENEDRVWVKFAGDKIWAGHIKVKDPTFLDEKSQRIKVWQLDGQDYTSKLDDSVITRQDDRPRESADDRVAFILGHLNFNITTAGVDLPAEMCERANLENLTVREALQQVADELVLHFYIDFGPDDGGPPDLHMFRTETFNAPFDLVDTGADFTTTFPYSEFKRPTDSQDYKNRVRVKGERHRRWVVNQAEVDDKGPQETAVTDESLFTLAQVEAAGRRVLDQNDTAEVHGEFLCHEPGLRAGMRFQLENSEWSIDESYIATQVSISAVDPEDADDEAYLWSRVSFSDKRRVGRMPGGGRRPKAGDRDNGDGRSPTDRSGRDDRPGTCCNPIPTGPSDLIDWGDANIMGFEQGHTSGTSHSITLPDGSGYVGGVVGGDIIDRHVFLFMLTVDELPGNGGGLDTLDPTLWQHINSEVLACTHGFFPFNAGHPNMQTHVYRFDVDADPGEYPEAGGTVVVASDDAIEVLWVTVLVGGVGDTIEEGPGSTDWDMADWVDVPVVDTGNRALYLSIAWNQYWNNTEHGLGLSAEDHDTPVIGGLPADFTRLTQAVGGDKIINVDYAFSPVDTGAGLPTLSMTGYIGSSSGSQDFIITRLYGIEVRTTASGEITPGPTWEGGNPLIYDGGNVPPYAITGGVVTITSDTMFDVWSWVASGPPDMPTSVGDWIISQRFNLTTAGSLTDDGGRNLQIGVDFDGLRLEADVRFGDTSFAQGVHIKDAEDSFTAKDIVEGEDHIFQVKWDGTTLYARFWLEADGEPAADAWDVQSVTLQAALDPEGDGLDRFYYSVGIGNDGGTPMALVLPPPTIEGLALAGETVDWEIVGYGDNTTVTFPTRYPYDELSLHVRVDAQQLNGTAFTMDGAAGTITLDSAPYGDPSDPTGSSVVEARYTRV